MVDVPERNPASCEHRLLTGVVCRAREAVDCGDDLPETVLRMAVVFLELQRPVARQRAKNQHLRPVAQQRPETGLSVQFAIHIIYACNNILHESRASAGVRPRPACPSFPPAMPYAGRSLRAGSEHSTAMADFLNFSYSVADSVSGVCAAPAGLSRLSACRSRIRPGQSEDGQTSGRMQQAAVSGQHGKIKQKKKPARMSRSQSYSDAAKTYSAATTITLMSAKTPL